MQTVENFLRVLNTVVHNITLDSALILVAEAQAFASPGPIDYQAMTLAERAAAARTMPSVVEKLIAGTFIQAIKEFRTTTGLGLKDSKDALDIIKEDYLPPPLSDYLQVWERDLLTRSDEPPF